MLSKLNIEKIEGVNHEVNRKLSLYISGGGIIVAMALLIVDASMRTFFSRPIWGMLDVIEIILVWLVFAAFAWALITGTHVRMSLVKDRLPSRLRSGCEIFSNLMGIGFFALFTYLAIPYFWTSFLVKETPMSPIPSPVWLGKAVMPIGGIMMLIAFIIRLIRTLRKGEVFEEEIKGF